ncbi:hypothetical protein MOBUDSM44075_04232 [Mycolicibacterium obuense]|uniref:Uncharacterized protein n=1 Tax=Mycolicibacterium obuense TaxID=1807 RepID=A0A0J6VNU5_9MYCO|nr:hypothetical protein MOBUDSM44075_04232 [Mycolicibacterium obuense]
MLVPADGESEQSGVVVGVAVVGDEDVEQRVAAGNPRRVQRVDDAVEGQIGVGERGEIRCADAGEQFGEGGVARHIGAQHHGVDEQTDELAQHGVVAAGDRRTDDEVATAAQPVKESGDRGVEHHQHARLLIGGHTTQRRDALGIERQIHCAAGA